MADATRKRISEILHEVGYRPHFAARALAAKRTDVIQVILAAPMFHGHGQTLLSVMTEAAAAGLSVVVSRADPDQDVDAQTVPFDVDGVIILGGQEPTVDMAIKTAAFAPTVLLLSNQHSLPGVSTVSVDNFAGSYQATRHLLDQGVLDLMHIEGDRSWADAAQRRDGFLAACREYGVQAEVLHAGSWGAQKGYEAASAAFDERGEGGVPFGEGAGMGIVAANDQLALGALRAAHERGVSVPYELSVVGFDDSEGAQCYLPPLTTVRQGFDKVGSAAIRQLAQLQTGDKPQDIVIDPELVIRASSTTHM